MVSWNGSGPLRTLQPGRSAVRRLSTWFSKSWAFIVVCWPIADVTGSLYQPCIDSKPPVMPFRRWFGGGQGGLRDRLMTALQQARDGHMAQATATISERFPEALQQLETLQPTADGARLRLAAWLAYRSGDMQAGMDYARRALAVGEDAWTWHLVGRAGLWLSQPDAETAFRKAATLDPEDFVVPYRVSRDRFHA